MSHTKLFFAAAASFVTWILGSHLLLVQGVSDLLWSSLAALLLTFSGLKPFPNKIVSLKLSQLEATVLQLSLIFVGIYRVQRGGELDILFIQTLNFVFTWLTFSSLIASASTLSLVARIGVTIIGFLTFLAIPFSDISFGFIIAVVLSFMALEVKSRTTLLTLAGAIFIASFLNERTYSQFYLGRILGKDAKYELTYLASSYGRLDFTSKTQIKQPETVFEATGKLDSQKRELHFHNSNLKKNIENF